MAPHLQQPSNIALAIVLFCVLSFCWKIGTCVVIFVIYFRQGHRTPSTVADRGRYQHVAFISLSYVLMMCLTVGAMLWDLYHVAIACWCFPLPVRIAFTVPAMLSGDYALWRMVRYQFHGLFANKTQ